MTTLSKDVLKLDCALETERIAVKLRAALVKMKKRGLVVAMSGGIDSSVVGALAVRILGKDRVFGLLMPEVDSSDDTRRLSKALVEGFGCNYAHEELTPVLDALGCYRRRDEAIKKAIPDYGPGWKSKIVLPSVVDSDQMRTYSVVAHTPDGREVKAHMPLDAYLGVVAATNFKQRTRKMLEYYHADRLNYATSGTPNLLEYDQGFFVKLGDGAADIKPIAHLYKSQVYMMAEHLGVPAEIRARPPTTDTYSLPQSQEEFYFSLPYDKMDLCLYAKIHGITPEDCGKGVGLSAAQVERVYRDIEGKRAVARYLHMEPQLIDDAIKPR